MAAAEPDFRDYGLHPDMAAAAPPREHVHCYLTRGRIVGQWAITLFVASLSAGLCTLFVMFLPSPMRWIAMASAAFTSVVGIDWMVRRSYSSLRLEGNRLLLKQLYTGRSVERSIDDIELLTAIVMSSGEIGNAIANKMLGRFRGFDVRFRDGRTLLRVTRADPAMTNAREFLEGVLQRMSQCGTVAAEVVEFEGRPAVKTIQRSDRELEAEPSFHRLRYLLTALFLSLIVGPMLAFLGAEQQDKYEVGTQPPREITISDLVRKGPGENRHVTLTGYQIDGYVAETKNDSWTSVTVALYPNDPPLQAQREIRAVLELKGIRDELDLKAKLIRGRVTGICAAEPRTRWGETLGPKLVAANGGRTLKEAWYVEEMSAPPSELTVQALLIAAVISFAIAFILTLLVVIRR
jgi:hypothetical protein